MKILITKFIILILAITVFSLPVNGTDYFVDRSHPSSSDSNPGTEQSPWLTIQHAAITATAGDTVWIKSGTYNERVVPTHSGSQDNPIIFCEYSGHSVILDGNGVTLPPEWGALLELSGLSNITVSGLTVQNVGIDNNHIGILVDGSSNITIESCRTYNTVSSGIAAWNSSNITIRHNEVELACNDGEQECITVAQTSYFVIRNNEVHHNGPGSNGAEGIDAKDGSTHGVIAENHVHNLNRLGIYIDAWDKHTFNIEVFGNRVHDCQGSGFAVASEAGGLLENIKIYNNLAYNNYYNGVNLGHYGEPVPTRPLKNIWVINNTFVANGTSGWGGGIYAESQDAAGIVIRNNICANNATFQILLESTVPGVEFTIDHNLIQGFRGEPGEVRGTDFVEGDPVFRDMGQHDFHLTVNSPAIDSGNATNAPADDFDGIIRPQGPGIDIGAFEYQQTVPGIVFSLKLSEKVFEMGDAFILTETITNGGPETYHNQPAVVLLDALGAYFWYPDWTPQFQYDSVSIPLGSNEYELLNFMWPTVEGSASGIYFYGAVLSNDFMSIIGTYDAVEFGWK